MPSADLTSLLALVLLGYAAWPLFARSDGLRVQQVGSGRWVGRLLTLSLLSSGLRYGFALFSFPLRLMLSAWAGKFLSLAGLPVRVAGNVLVYNGLEMAVDPACMGLQLTGVSLLVGLFFLILAERQVQKTVPLWAAAGYSGLLFGLILLCNLLRITLLVLFRALPDTPAHELIGLACVGAYAWLPAWRLSRCWTSWFGQRVRASVRLDWLKPILLGTLVLLTGRWLHDVAARPTPTSPLTNQSNWLKLAGESDRTGRWTTLPNGFVQIARPGVLIYLKPQPDWFSADHSPMTCWRGSGYDLRYVRETRVQGHPAYVGELHRNGRVLYTTWWFTNGRATTVSQVGLRGRMLRGETGFVLVNRTVEKRAILYPKNNHINGVQVD